MVANYPTVSSRCSSKWHTFADMWLPLVLATGRLQRVSWYMNNDNQLYIVMLPVFYMGSVHCAVPACSTDTGVPSCCCTLTGHNRHQYTISACIQSPGVLGYAVR